MNRKHHIIHTLPKNIKDNESYLNVEFILLDYGSTDNLEKWIEDEMAEYIVNGKLRYYKTYEPNYFLRSHSRNMAFRLATGDILCNIDADNYTGYNFAVYVNDYFKNNTESFLTIDHNGFPGRSVDVYGKFCCRKEDFHNVGGMDEHFINYGWEDIDLYQRFELSGIKESFIENYDFIQIYKHESIERIENEHVFKNFHSYYINYITPLKSEIICLYKDNTFESGHVIPNREDKTFAPMCIEEKQWLKGTWEILENKTFIFCNENNYKRILNYKQNHNVLVENRDNKLETFYRIFGDSELNDVLRKHSIASNYERMLTNKEDKIINPNKGSYGKGKVIENLNFAKIISL